MSGRRAPAGLRLLAESRSNPGGEARRQAAVGGIGLEWTDVPAVLDAAGRAEWERLSRVYEGLPVRFREGDRAAVTSYCVWFAAFEAAARDLAGRGPVVEGRSAKDRDRTVKNPASVALREASVQLRYWCRELGLTPDARGRAGLDDGELPPPDDNNPFSGQPNR